MMFRTIERDFNEGFGVSVQESRIELGEMKAAGGPAGGANSAIEAVAAGLLTVVFAGALVVAIWALHAVPGFWIWAACAGGLLVVSFGERWVAFVKKPFAVVQKRPARQEPPNGQGDQPNHHSIRKKSS